MSTDRNDTGMRSKKLAGLMQEHGITRQQAQNVLAPPRVFCTEHVYNSFQDTPLESVAER